MRLLKKHGFVYHSNMMDSDDPYFHGGDAAGLVEALRERQDSFSHLK